MTVELYEVWNLPTDVPLYIMLSLSLSHTLTHLTDALPFRTLLVRVVLKVKREHRQKGESENHERV